MLERLPTSDPPGGQLSVRLWQATFRKRAFTSIDATLRTNFAVRQHHADAVMCPPMLRSISKSNL